MEQPEVYEQPRFPALYPSIPAHVHTQASSPLMEALDVSKNDELSAILALVNHK
jgi:hypothetical protein